jgi:hypothetical protein
MTRMRISRGATAAALAVVFSLPGAAAAQSQNPALRAAATTPRVAAQNRLPLQVSQRAVTGASPFFPACGDRSGTVYIGAEVEPHVAINPLDPSHLVGVWQQDRYSNGGSRGLAGATSFDGGATWVSHQIAFSVCAGGDYDRATDPWVAFAPDGTVHQIALGISGASFTPTGVSAVLASRSIDGGLTWSAPVTLIRDVGSFFNDKETITADPLDPRFVYAVWDRLQQGGGGPSFFARSTDRGITWEAARSIYNPGASFQTIANLVRVLPNGTLVNVFMQLPNSGSASPAIYVIRSTDRGVTWSSAILVSLAGPLGAEDPDTGTPIRDGSIVPQMAVAPDGTLYVAWQDARFTQARDAIALARSTDGGLTWSTPVRVNADPGVWAFTPQVHVREDGVIGVTYYDLRSNTADTATLPADFWLARSSDGVNWTETRVSGAFNLATAPFAGGYFLGDYTGLVSAGTTFVPFYAKTTGNASSLNDIFVARVGAGASALEKHSYPAVEMPQADPGAEFWEAVARGAARALQRRLPAASPVR